MGIWPRAEPPRRPAPDVIRRALIGGGAGEGKLPRMSSRSGAGGLAAARDVDLLLERLEADRAHDHFFADHVARRAVEPERLGELPALLDRGEHLVAAHVLLDARHVEARLLGGLERARLVGLAAAAEQPLVEIEVLLALVLHAHR